jgi:hypothetical protein
MSNYDERLYTREVVGCLVGACKTALARLESINLRRTYPDDLRLSDDISSIQEAKELGEQWLEEH